MGIVNRVYHNFWDKRKSHTTRSKIRLDGVVSVCNLRYGPDAKNNIFDIHFPKDNKNQKLPTILLIHGGGHVSGQKEGDDAYAKTLASHGFCVINMEYTKCDGPENKFFVDEVAEVFMLLKHIKQNQNVLCHVDFNNFFLGGDSAGAHIAAMVANLQTNPFLKENFYVIMSDSKLLQDSTKIKGVILSSPLFGAYKFGGFSPLKNPVEDMIYGKNIDETAKEILHNFDVLTNLFPPTMMISSKKDCMVKIHKPMFIKRAKNLNIPLLHYQVENGYKLSHNIVTKYPDCYPLSIQKIVKFVKYLSNDGVIEGQHLNKIHEEENKPKEVEVFNFE